MLEAKLQQRCRVQITLMRTPVCSVRSVKRRKAVRFDLRAQVTYHWKDQSGTNQEGVGRTRNISISGVFVVCSSPPSVGTPVGLEIELPPLERNAPEHLRLETQGNVIRVTGADQEIGFAATSQFEMHEILS
jgi:hypothetical protein